MGTLPIGKLLRKMSLPLIISMLVQVLYGLVDSMYVARLGDSALTAISLCMPVQYLAGKDIITTNYVRYTDAYVKADGKWYIKRRRTLYGVYAFVRRQIGSYMFLQNQFVFFDFGEPRIFFFMDYLAVMCLFAVCGYYAVGGAALLEKRRKRT